MLKNKTLLKCMNCSVVHGNEYILKDISFKIKQGELISIVGNNGAGKSTICKLITNNISLTSGNILKAKNVKIAYVPQVNNFNIIVPISALDFIMLNKKNKELTPENLELLKQLSVINLLQKNFHSLSGGEKQKVILSRALLLNPDILVLDEPVSFIDFANKGGVYDIINSLRKKNKISVIMVSHDLNLVLNDSTWVLCISKGMIKCQGQSIHINQEKEFTKLFGNNWGYYQHLGQHEITS